MKYKVVKSFPELGLQTALRFLNWVAMNPEGVISLPTGKTPEYFIKWTQKILDEWGSDEIVKLLDDHGFDIEEKPDLCKLRFVQIDDFYPIDPKQHNSFYNYVNEYYIKGFGLDRERALLINTEDIPIKRTPSPDGKGAKGVRSIFPDLSIDLTLRYRSPESPLEELQREAIFSIDNWCQQYEEKIRQMGGIGFFLGGIGPDGHIAFNMRGSDHHSTTRLTKTNYETQAASAGDLGGIEVSKNRLVITIGLGTISFDPEVTAIIFAAGEAKSQIIKDAIEGEPSVEYPATVLHNLPNSCFILTKGAARLLKEEQEKFFAEGEWSKEKDIRALLNYCEVENVYAHKIGESFQFSELSFQKGNYSAISNLQSPIKEIVKEVENRLLKGLEKTTNSTILHSGPHHDDIMLGIMPLVNRQLREASNRVHFAVMTSGFTAISNRFLIDSLRYTLKLIDAGKIEMVLYSDFFESGYLFKWDKDVNHYLNKVAEQNDEGKRRGMSHRVARCLVRIYGMKSVQELRTKIREIIKTVLEYYDGEKNSPDIQQLKGMIREFEEELVWAHSGKQVSDVHHLRLGFYKGDIFTEQPELERDAMPILELLRKVDPDILSVTMDPEGSGPDTHFKVLQATALALRLWSKEKDLSKLKIIGYRNVWYRYHPGEANIYVPVTLNSLATMQNSFRQCYLSQVDASFPSPEMNAPFCDLAQKMWVDQFREVQLLLGKDYFYQNELPILRATHGLLFVRELELEEFLGEVEVLAGLLG